MTFTILNKGIHSKISRSLRDAQQQHSESLQKLSSGEIFTASNPRPSERALAEKMEYRLRGLTSAKRNINDAVSLIQTAEGGFGEISNIITRMKEINIAAASTTVTDQERKFLFIEYEALYDEINRISQTTKFNGIPLLDGSHPDTPNELVFRLGDPVYESEDGEEDLNILRLSGLNDLSARPDALGLMSAAEFLVDLEADEGVTIDDAQDLMASADDLFSTVYDQALTNLTKQRAVFGAIQGRLNRSLDFIDVYQENIAAAKSKIADTDFVEETSKMVESKIRMSAATAMLTQANFASQAVMSLVNNVLT